jgi:hypothetical protein
VLDEAQLMKKSSIETIKKSDHSFIETAIYRSLSALFESPLIFVQRVPSAELPIRELSIPFPAQYVA